MLFTGGAGSITHMHFDIDLSHILPYPVWQAARECLMFPFTEQHKLYRKPWEVLSLADFSQLLCGERNMLTTKNSRH